jgi:ABC-type sugar transport system ATPase subunit
MHMPSGSVTVVHPRDAVAAKVGFVSGERSLGLFPALSVRDNIVIPHLAALTEPYRLDEARISAAVSELIRLLDIRPADPDALAGRLSGGNQQKVLFARWLVGSLDLLLLDDPTAGVDVAAKAQIHQLIEGVAARGGSVLASSTDMPELMTICDRLLAVRQGRVVGELRREPAFDEVRVRTMVGGA